MSTKPSPFTDDDLQVAGIMLDIEFQLACQNIQLPHPLAMIIKIIVRCILKSLKENPHGT